MQKMEYLFVFEKKDGLCQEISQFVSLLNSHYELDVDATTIKYDETSFDYTLKNGKFGANNDDTYFDFTITYSNDDVSDRFCNVLKIIRELCYKVTKRAPVLLYDGLSEKICNKAYPYIYAIENKMRKLITKFMIVSIGADWDQKTMPKEVKDSVKNVTGNGDGGFLYQVDFIQLSNYLFKPYKAVDEKHFFESLEKKADDASVPVVEMRQYIPRTNWEKYFLSKVKVESNYIKSKWEKLYEYRCQIAHCRNLTQNQLEDVIAICEDLDCKIETALGSITELQISEEEKETVAENISGVSNEKIAELIVKYNQLILLQRLICEKVSDENDIYFKADTNRSNSIMQVRYLTKNKGIFSQEMSLRVIQSTRLKNFIVHSAGLEPVEEGVINECINAFDSAIAVLKSKTDSELETLKGRDLATEYGE